jgi:hypothetical protein
MHTIWRCRDSSGCIAAAALRVLQPCMLLLVVCTFILGLTIFCCLLAVVVMFAVAMEAAAGGGVYRPPKLNPVAMEEDRALSNKERRRLLEAQRRAQRR